MALFRQIAAPLHRPTGPWLLCSGWVILLASGGRLEADSIPLLLDVSINGQPLKLIGDFLQQDGKLMAKASEWKSFGILLPSKLVSKKDTLVDMANLPGISGRLDTTQQTLSLTVASSSLVPHTFYVEPDQLPQTGGSNDQDDTGGAGAVLNYDMNITTLGRTITPSVLLDGRVFSRRGVLDMTGLAQMATGTPGFTRLDSTYTYSNEDGLRRYQAGDVITGSLAWSHSLRLAGFQISSDFALQPNLVTFPVPAISGTVAVPSTVDLLVNGIREFSQDVPSGPFEFRQIPVVIGAENVAIQIRDLQGRETTQTLPFYASTDLLKSGLSAYSFELGSLRYLYGIRSNDYGIPVGSGLYRYGVNDHLTLETHAETAPGIVEGGVSAIVKLGDIGELSGALAGSEAGKQGALCSIGFQRHSGRLSLNATSTRATWNYRDVAAKAGDSNQIRSDTAGLSLSLGPHIGVVGLTYTSLVYHSGPISSNALIGQQIFSGNISALSASYSIQLPHNISLFTSSFWNFAQHGALGMSLGFSMPLGERSSVGSYVSRSQGAVSGGVYASQSAIDVGETGWNINLGQGQSTIKQASVNYKSPWGTASAEVDQSLNEIGERVGMRGALVAAGGGFFATNPIDDGFAVVKVGDFPGIHVLRANRPIGTTDQQGRLLVPDLLSYQDNSIAIDPLDLPQDAQVGDLTRIVKPRDRSGAIVNFVVKRSNAAQITLVDSAGNDLPPGSLATLQGAGDATPIGYDGVAYMTELTTHNVIDVALPSGQSCQVIFSFIPKPGDIPMVGPFTCR